MSNLISSTFVHVVSGVFSDKEHAQSQVSVGVAIYAGTTVFSLTFQWSMSMLSSSESLKEESDEREETSRSIFPKIRGRLRIFLGLAADHLGCVCAVFAWLKKKWNFGWVFFFFLGADNGVNVDPETCQTAKIMLLSLIPYVILQLVYAFDYTSSVRRTITLIALVVSIVSLINSLCLLLKFCNSLCLP